ALDAAARLDGAELDDRVQRLAEAGGLSDELDVALLALCAAPELDGRYGRLIAYLHDDVGRRNASPRLIAALLAGHGASEVQVYQRLAADAPLRASGIVRMLSADPGVPLADRMLAIDELAAGVLIGADLEPSLGEGMTVVARTSTTPQRPALVQAVRDAVASPDPIWIAVTGPDADQVLAHACGCDVVVLDVAAAADPAFAARGRLLAVLRGLPLAVRVSEPSEVATNAVLRTVIASGAGVLLADNARALDGIAGRTVATFPVPALTDLERRDAWAAALPDAPTGPAAQRFALTHAQILSAAALAKASAAPRACAADPTMEQITAAARTVTGISLGPLASRLDPAKGWDDLILPPAQTTVLKAIVAFVTHRGRVRDEWGFGQLPGAPLGLTALFAGPSGTGKTLAARVLAEELGLDAFRIDLSAIVSKYIGETEKHLDNVFRTADETGALLIFDEADALFGKRSAVTDARDRYANLEVAFLLQRLESHDGVVILTTNLRQNLDTAFLRRLDFAIDFPTPDRVQRQALWRRHLPRAAPLDDDVRLDLLAADYELSGGSISTCARLAAFAAAVDGRIAMRHLRSAVDLELEKHGRLAGNARRSLTAASKPPANLRSDHQRTGT
ncbi:MAG: family ATPase, partial [Solirubrobacterales bacterium]|nr:family ATPase [Solirubrobacterales bacterium]